MSIVKISSTDLSPTPLIEPKPYHTVHFDLTELSTGFYHDRWLAHFTCQYTQIYHGYTISSRSKIPSIFNSFIANVRIQFRAQVCQIEMGNEALKESFKDTFDARGIKLLTSSQYTAQPNSVAERAGR